MEHYLTPETTEAQKKVIAAFCFDLLKALEGESQEQVLGGSFPCHSLGLCGNMNIWAEKKEIDCVLLLNYRFKSTYPFGGGFDRYFHETANRRIFQNKKRMEFVKYWAAKHVDKGE